MLFTYDHHYFLSLDSMLLFGETVEPIRAIPPPKEILPHQNYNHNKTIVTTKSTVVSFYLSTLKPSCATTLYFTNA